MDVGTATSLAMTGLRMRTAIKLAAKTMEFADEITDKKEKEMEQEAMLKQQELDNQARYDEAMSIVKEPEQESDDFMFGRRSKYV